jgi:lipoic acid synthetase
MSAHDRGPRLPDWLRTRRTPAELRRTKGLLRAHGVHTVCEEARCPNQGVCFTKPTATFMILGDRCTRGCGFCAVAHSGAPAALAALDPGEPERVARAALAMALEHVVITSVTRDDLPDGGAAQFAATVRAVRSLMPRATVEILTPDFRGDLAALAIAAHARPDVFNHNVETVPALYARVRPGAVYGRSLLVLREARALLPGGLTKSGLMVGLGESLDEVRAVMRDLREAGCGMLTVGQYLRPGRGNLPVAEYIEPGVFDALGDEARAMGFRHVASGPLVRSSWDARETFASAGPGMVQ